MGSRNIAAIIVAAGRGSRLSQNGTDGAHPKQYRLIGNKCILQHTLDKFTGHPLIDYVLCVIHENDGDMYQQLISTHAKLLPPVIGAQTRQQSVMCGLEEICLNAGIDKVLIHDAARPFVSASTISCVLEQINIGVGAIPAHALTDTLNKANQEKRVTRTIPRENLYCVQTPQGFIPQEIVIAHRKAAKSGDNNYSDDASIFKAFGGNVQVVDAPADNFKITTLHDLKRAQMVYDNTQNHHPDIRTGTGYDVHAFAAGSKVILCGVTIPFDKKLKGHSDADVALHALTDALLGTIGAGDIGTFFPPSDAQWKDAPSHIFLNTALEKVTEKGGRINNIDITIICEAPQIGPFRLEMQLHLAGLCSLDAERVSIKATTNEKLGFLGRGEGIAAMASATLSFVSPGETS